MTHVSFNAWLHALWDEIGVPHTTRNARVGIAWMYTESGSPDGRGKGGEWNPLNCVWQLTAQTAPSGVASTPIPGNSAGVQNYATMQDGLYATKRTILQNCCGFPKIMKRLRLRGLPATAVLRAIDASDWGTGHLVFEVYGDIKRGAYAARAGTLVNGSY